MSLPFSLSLSLVPLFRPSVFLSEPSQLSYNPVYKQLPTFDDGVTGFVVPDGHVLSEAFNECFFLFSPPPMHTGSTFGYGLTSHSILSALFTFLSLSTLLQPVFAVPRNVTIDDQGGDSTTGIVPTYAPPASWGNQFCSGCAILPDPNQLFNRTSMSATYRPFADITPNTIDFDFNGTAIYIFFTLFYNEGQGIVVSTECNFTLDNAHAGFFNHSADPTRPAKQVRDYQALVFSKTGLAQEPHHMRISVSDVSYQVFISFDYAIYTTDVVLDIPESPHVDGPAATQTSNPSTESPSSTTTNPTSNRSGVSAGVIAGAVIGGLVVLTGFALLFYCFRRDRKRYRRPSSPGATSPRVFSMETYTEPDLHQHQPSPSLVDTSVTPFLGVLSKSSQDRKFPISSSALRPAHSSSTLPSMEVSVSPPQSQSSSTAGSRFVENQIRAANIRMRNLREEIASANGPSGSRVTEELMEEVKSLRQEIQALRQLQRQQAPELPPYTLE